MTCATCGETLVETARFCPHCGAKQPEVEDPAKVAEYQRALAALGHRAEAWALAELQALRAELGIRPATHDRLLAQLAAPDAPPIGVDIDAEVLRHLRAGEQALLRFRVTNQAPSPLVDVRLTVRSSSVPEPAETSLSEAFGPGEARVVSVLLPLPTAGHHEFTGAVEIQPLRGGPSTWRLAPTHVRVGAAAALQQSIHIDARSQKVGIFENIGGSTESGLVGRASWKPISLQREEAPSTLLAPPPLEPVTSHGSLTERIHAAEPGAVVDVEGTHTGPLVLRRPITLRGAPGATLEIERGAALIIQADARIEGFTIRSTAPPGGYAPDGIEVQTGRVILSQVQLHMHTEGVLTPGRGVAVTGPAHLEVEGGEVTGCGVGLAVDVGWGGFAANRARGARVSARQLRLADNGVAAAVAGPDRELHLAHCTFAGNRDGSVRALDGAYASVQHCDVSANELWADDPSTIEKRGNPS